MAQISYRANLSAKQFPLLSTQGGKTVIVKGQDQNFIPSVVSKADEDKDVGIPQLYYGHNFLPTESGFDAVGLQRVASPPAIPGVSFSNMYQIITEEGEVLIFSVTSGGRVMVLRAPLFNFWQQIAFIPGIENGLVTTAHVSGVTYIYFEGIGCYKYDTATMQLVAVTLTGVTTSAIKGVVESNGYLLVFDELSVLWCSLLDVTDFVPDLITGAGGGMVEELQGTIVTCVPTASGFVIYGTSNIVVVTASANSRYPFQFRGLAGSPGIISAEHVTQGEDADVQYAYTKGGLQQVTLRSATPVFPQITDFISGNLWEDFVSATNTFEIETCSSALIRRISIISARYIAISYGNTTDSSHVLVYDLALKRFGKLRLNHVSTFEYSILAADAPSAFFGLLCSDGTVYRLSHEDQYKTDSVAILGRYQYVRARTIQLQSVASEVLSAGASVTAAVTTDGRTFSATQLGYQTSLGNHNFHITGESVALIYKGPFALTSVELSFNIHGKR